MAQDIATMPLADYKAACDAIRTATGTQDTIKSGELANLIRSVSGNVGSLTITANGTYSASAYGLSGFNTIVVNVRGSDFPTSADSLDNPNKYFVFAYDSTTQTYKVTNRYRVNGEMPYIANEVIVIPSLYNDGTHGLHPVSIIALIPQGDTNTSYVPFSDEWDLPYSLYIPNSITTIGVMAFYQGSGITNLVFEKNSAVAFTQSQIGRSGGFTKVILPNTITEYTASDELFSNCPNLEEIDLRNISSIGNWFIIENSSNFPNLKQHNLRRIIYRGISKPTLYTTGGITIINKWGDMYPNADLYVDDTMFNTISADNDFAPFNSTTGRLKRISELR